MILHSTEPFNVSLTLSHKQMICLGLLMRSLNKNYPGVMALAIGEAQESIKHRNFRLSTADFEALRYGIESDIAVFADMYGTVAKQTAAEPEVSFTSGGTKVQ